MLTLEHPCQNEDAEAPLMARIRRLDKELSQHFLNRLVTYRNRHASKKHKVGGGARGKEAVVGVKQRGGKTVYVERVESVDSATIDRIVSKRGLRPGLLCSRTKTRHISSRD